MYGKNECSGEVRDERCFARSHAKAVDYLYRVRLATTLLCTVAPRHIESSLRGGGEKRKGLEAGDKSLPCRDDTIPLL